MSQNSKPTDSSEEKNAETILGNLTPLESFKNQTKIGQDNLKIGEPNANQKDQGSDALNKSHNEIRGDKEDELWKKDSSNNESKSQQNKKNKEVSPKRSDSCEKKYNKSDNEEPVSVKRSRRISDITHDRKNETDKTSVEKDKDGLAVKAIKTFIKNFKKKTDKKKDYNKNIKMVSSDDSTQIPIKIETESNSNNNLEIEPEPESLSQDESSRKKKTETTESTLKNEIEKDKSEKDDKSSNSPEAKESQKKIQRSQQATNKTESPIVSKPKPSYKINFMVYVVPEFKIDERKKMKFGIWASYMDKDEYLPLDFKYLFIQMFSF